MVECGISNIPSHMATLDGLSTCGASPGCCLGHAVKAALLGSLKTIKIEKPPETASKPSPADCEDKTCAELLLCPGETKLFMMFCTLPGIQNWLSSQWDYLRPIVAQQDNVLK